MNIQIGEYYHDRAYYSYLLVFICQKFSELSSETKKINLSKKILQKLLSA